MAKKRPSLSAVVDFMSEEAQARVREGVGILSPLPLESILPDPLQPRQLLPEDLAVAVNNGDISPYAALSGWVKKGRSIKAEPSLRHDVRELRRLADSIEQHGLINPIPVRRVPSGFDLPAGVKYLIITGERRYWAHVLLVAEERKIQEGLETRDPHQIKATIAPEGISVRAHQIVENVMREDIDAVEKAQGFLALRFELSGVDYKPEAVGEGVNHGSPLVSWGRVEESLNVSRRYRQYVTSVLNLSNEAQSIIKQHGLSERAIRPISQKLGNRPDLQVAALNQLVVWQGEAVDDSGQDGALTAAVKTLVDDMMATEEQRAARERARALIASVPIQARRVEQLQGRIAGPLRFLEKLSEEELAALGGELASKEAHHDTVADLQRLRQKLHELLVAMSENQAS